MALCGFASPVQLPRGARSAPQTCRRRPRTRAARSVRMIAGADNAAFRAASAEELETLILAGLVGKVRGAPSTVAGGLCFWCVSVKRDGEI